VHPRLRPAAPAAATPAPVTPAAPAVARLALALVVAATLAGIVAAPAAQAAWSPARTLAQPAAENLAVAGNAQRTQIFAWRVTTKRFLRLPAQTGFASHVSATVRLPSGTLGAARIISSTKEIVANPAVALDARGDTTVVWSQAGSHVRIMGAYRPNGGSFGTPFEIGRTSAFISSRPAIAVAANGAAVIAWNGGNRMQVARRPAGRCRAGRAGLARGCFGRPQSFVRGTDQAVATTPGGTAFVVWAATVRRAGAVHTALRLTIAPPGGLFGPGRPIPGPGDASQPALAIGPHGTAIIAWRGSLPAGGEQNADATIFAAVRNSNGVLAGPQPVSLFPGSNPHLRVNGQGEAILAWDERNPTPQNPDGPEVATSVRDAAGGAFPAPVTISPAGTAAGSASLAVDATGTATLAYTASLLNPGLPGGAILALSHRRPPGGVFGRPELLPAQFSGAFVFAADALVSAVSGGSDGRTALSDYVS
jgi:hypothetical protein